MKRDAKIGPDGKLIHPSPFKAGRNIGIRAVVRDNPIRPLSNQFGKENSNSPRRRDQTDNINDIQIVAQDSQNTQLAEQEPSKFVE